MASVSKLKLSVRRLVENEVVFRQLNEMIEIGIEEINRISDPTTKTPPLMFYCECADEKCVSRIKISLMTYRKIHKDPRCFVVKPGHELELIEDVELKKPNYFIVKKRMKVPKTASKLHPTPLYNI